MFPTKRLEGKNILVGITGGIAAYKSCELIRYLVTQGAHVRAMMTANGEKFISRLTIESLCNYPVYTEMFPEGRYAATHHIELADWAEAVIIIPATANIIGKMANGIGDDFLSTNLLALHCPTVFAPAMNSNMWLNPAVQRNIATLKGWGYAICNPETGFLAEGYSGVGRLARLEYQVQHLYRAIHPHPESLKGKTVLITAGGTREHIDPVRMLTNRATGKMGFALAWEAFARGAAVILVHGPGSLIPPVEVESHGVISAAEMFDTVQRHFPRADLFISAAAVADYTPARYSTSKIKKEEQGLTLKLERTRDVLKTMSQQKKAHQRVIGFAVETDNPLENARKKLIDKNLDMIALNNPSEAGAGFGVDTNKVTVMTRDDARELTPGYKLDVAGEIFDRLLGTGEGGRDD